MVVPRVGLLGSCVTREPLALLKSEVEIPWYQARTSIPSMAAAPVYLPLRFDGNAMPPFEQRNVHWDLCKTWIANINRNDYDFLLIDFIDERFGCADYAGTRFTWSTSFRAATVEENYLKAIKTTMPTTPSYAEMIKENLPFVALHLSALKKPVICNNLYWSFTMDNGSTDEKFPESRFGIINDNLRIIYDYLAKHTSIHMLNVPRDMLRASSSHKWKSAPFHYTQENDEYIARRLLEKIAELQ